MPRYEIEVVKTTTVRQAPEVYADSEDAARKLIEADIVRIYAGETPQIIKFNNWDLPDDWIEVEGINELEPEE